MLVLAGLVCLNRNAATQSAAPEKPTPIADTADRISRALWPTQADPTVQPNMPVFRANVTVDVWALPVPWHLTERPGPTNRRFNGYHQEHLMMTTPEAFRTSTFYPIGVGIDPATIVNGAKKAWRDRQAAKIRQRIAEELAALERANNAVAAGEGGAEH